VRRKTFLRRKRGRALAVVGVVRRRKGKGSESSEVSVGDGILCMHDDLSFSQCFGLAKNKGKRRISF
jgi:hypothetical protein